MIQQLNNSFSYPSLRIIQTACLDFFQDAFPTNFFFKSSHKLGRAMRNYPPLSLKLLKDAQLPNPGIQTLTVSSLISYCIPLHSFFLGCTGQLIIPDHEAHALSACPPSSLSLKYNHSSMKMTVLVAWLCPTLCNPLDGSPVVSPVHGILQARILEWVAFFETLDQVLL